MKLTNNLGWKYILNNKKRSTFIILSIILVSIFITTIIVLISSYQQYLVKITREKKNWEAEFENVTYKDSLIIAKDDNVKEVSINRNVGLSKEDVGIDDFLHIQLNVYEFDTNALKNANLKITQGRLPRNSDELVISEGKGRFGNGDNGITNVKVGDIIHITLDGKIRQYFVVGMFESSEFDEGSWSGHNKIGAISYLDTSKINDNTKVNVGIITKNIQKIYKTVDSLRNSLNINLDTENVNTSISEEEQLDDILNQVYNTNVNNVASIEYNEELLNYECVLDTNSEFIRNLIIVSGFLILIVSIASIVMIKTAFSMSYLDRIKELGTLSSIGMSKKQRKQMMNFETRILGCTGVFVGVILGILFSFLMINILNGFIKLIDTGIFSVGNNGLSVKIPIIALLVIVLIVWIIVKISSFLPMKKINKISLIEAIKNSFNTKISLKQIKTPKWVEKILKEDGVLAYKNTKRDKNRNRTIEISLVISLVLFLSINALLSHIDRMSHTGGTTDDYADYVISISPTDINNKIIDLEKADKVMQYLEKSDLIYDCYGSMLPLNSRMFELKNDQISDTIKKMIDDGALNIIPDANGSIKINLEHLWIFGEAYNKILEKAGISELKDNEVIISNCITENTKYGNNVNITNFKVGDSYTLDIGEDVGRKEKIEKTFTIVGIVDDFSPYITTSFNSPLKIYQLISPKAALNLVKEYDYPSYAEIKIKTDKERAAKIDDKMYLIKKIYGENNVVVGENNLPIDFSEYKDSYSVQDVSKINTGRVSSMQMKNLRQVLSYSFVGFVILISAINVFNIIYTCIIFRKKDFAMLKSIGMSDKQIRWMTLKEGLLYGSNSIIYGIVISIIIQYIMYLSMTNAKIYFFGLSLASIIGSIIAMYIVIFFAIIIAKRKIKNVNIIDEMRQENI